MTAPLAMRGVAALGLAGVVALAASAGAVRAEPPPPAPARSAATAGAGPPQAQEGGSPARLRLADIPAWVEAGTSVAVDLRIEPVTPGLELVAAVRDRVTSRIIFERTVEGRSLGGALETATVDVDDLPSAADGSRRLLIDLGPEPPEAEPEAEPPPPGPGEPPAPPPPPEPAMRVPLGQEGVYPLELRLVAEGADTPSDRLVTHLVLFHEDEPPNPLAVAWVWPMGVGAPWQPDATLSESFLTALAPAGTLAEFTDALASAPDVALTMAPVPATVEAWSALAEGAAVLPDDPPTDDVDPAESASTRLETLRAAAAETRHQVLPGPYTDIDFTALLSSGLGGEVAAQLARGADVIRDDLAIRPDARTLVVTNVDGGVLTALRSAGVDRLVLEEESLLPLALDLTLARPFAIRSGGRTFLAASADPGLAEALVPRDDETTGNPPSAAALAHRFLAALSVVALEAPGQERGVVIVPPADWSPSASTLLATLAGLGDHPALAPVTLDGYFARVPSIDGESAVRQLRDTEPGTLMVDGDDIRGARRTLRSLADMLPEGDPTVETAERLLLLAESTTAQRRGRSAASARTYLDGVHAAVHGALGAISLPREHTVSLTAHEASIPITLVNDLQRPVRVRLRLRSDKLLFPEGDTQIVELAPRSTTAQFLVEARTAGTFTLTLELTSLDGEIVVDTATMRVRSTAVSGAALAVTFGAGLFLFGWWGNHIRKSRLARRAEEEAEARAVAVPPPEEG